jgi:hypothetical protein
MVPKHQSGDANSSVSFELAASNYFQSRQRIGSNSARQLIGSKFFQFFKKVQTTLKSFVNCYPLFFSRTLGNLLVPKRPAINWFHFLKSTKYFVAAIFRPVLTSHLRERK